MVRACRAWPRSRALAARGERCPKRRMLAVAAAIARALARGRIDSPRS